LGIPDPKPIDLILQLHDLGLGGIQRLFLPLRDMERVSERVE
jgi:hypothetical protein